TPADAFSLCTRKSESLPPAIQGQGFFAERQSCESQEPDESDTRQAAPQPSLPPPRSKQGYPAPPRMPDSSSSPPSSPARAPSSSPCPREPSPIHPERSRRGRGWLSPW